jgi:hypothetical protein
MEIVQEFSDEAVSGTADAMDRAGLTDLFVALKANGVRTVLVPEVNSFYLTTLTENTDRKDELVVMNVNLFTRIVWLSSSEDGKVNAAIEKFVTPGQIPASKGVNPA